VGRYYYCDGIGPYIRLGCVSTIAKHVIWWRQ